MRRSTTVVEPWEPNVTALLDRDALKWRHLVARSTPVPTPWPKAKFEAFQRDVQARRKQIRAERRPESDMDALFREEQAHATRLFARDALPRRCRRIPGRELRRAGLLPARSSTASCSRATTCRSAASAKRRSSASSIRTSSRVAPAAPSPGAAALDAPDAGGVCRRYATAERNPPPQITYSAAGGWAFHCATIGDGWRSHAPHTSRPDSRRNRPACFALGAAGRRAAHRVDGRRAEPARPVQTEATGAVEFMVSADRKSVALQGTGQPARECSPRPTCTSGQPIENGPLVVKLCPHGSTAVKKGEYSAACSPRESSTRRGPDRPNDRRDAGGPGGGTEGRQVYVNVHTDDGLDPPNSGPGDYRLGEIRGQLK